MGRVGARGSLIAWVAVAVLSGLAAGWFVFPSGRAASPLAFEPASFDLRGQTVFGGQSIRREARLVNRSGYAIDVEALSRSCGCMSFLGADQPKLPRRLGAGQSLPVIVEVDTTGRVGPQAFEVQAVGRGPDGELVTPPSFSIAASIKMGPIPSPAAFDESIPPDEAGTERVREILLADESGSSTFGEPKLSSSNPDRFRIGVVGAAPGRVNIGGLDLRRRHLVTIVDRLPSQPGVHEEFLFVEYPATRLPTIEIPVRCVVEPEVSWAPRQLAISPSEIEAVGAGSITRVIRFRSHREALASPLAVEAADLPTGVSIRRGSRLGPGRSHRGRLRASLLSTRVPFVFPDWSRSDGDRPRRLVLTALLRGSNMARSRREAVILLGLAIAGCTPAASPERPAPAAWAVEPDVVELDDVVSGDAVTVMAKLVNHSSGRARAPELSTSCPCLVVQVEESEIDPGRSTRLAIHFDSAREAGATGTLRIRIEAAGVEGTRLHLGDVTVRVVDRAGPAGGRPRP